MEGGKHLFAGKPGFSSREVFNALLRSLLLNPSSFSLNVLAFLLKGSLGLSCLNCASSPSHQAPNSPNGFMPSVSSTSITFPSFESISLGAPVGYFRQRDRGSVSSLCFLPPDSLFLFRLLDCNHSEQPFKHFHAFTHQNHCTPNGSLSHLDHTCTFCVVNEWRSPFLTHHLRLVHKPAVMIHVRTFSTPSTLFGGGGLLFFICSGS